jgi:hypothetical protein
MWSTQQEGGFHLLRCHCDYFRALFKISFENDDKKSHFDKPAGGRVEQKFICHAHQSYCE